MTFPTEWKNKSHVPNHQPDVIMVGGLEHGFYFSIQLGMS
jgi:hypothetical protein